MKKLEGSTSSDHLARQVRRLVTLVAAFVAISFPAGYLGLSHQHLSAGLAIDAEISAHLITQFINENPDIWPYNQHRLQQLLDQPTHHDVRESRRIYGKDGHLLMQLAGDERWPFLRQTGQLYDAGLPVGLVEIRHTLRPLLWRTGVASGAGLGLGIVVYWALSLLPLRALDRALSSLHDEKERAQVTLRSIGDGVITTDDQGRVQLLNEAAVKLTGWRAEEAMGRPLAEVFRLLSESNRTPVEDPANQVLRSGETVEGSNHGILISRSGHEYTISPVGAPIRDAKDRLVGVVLVFRDVTGQQREQEERFKIHKLESVGVLAGGIAHDFNNLLTAILNNVAIAQLQGKSPEKASEALQKAENAALRARHLTQQLMTFAKGGAPVRKTLHLPPVVEQAARFSISGSGVECAFSFAEELWTIEADEGQVTQVVSNLVVNADQAVRRNGTIRVACNNRTVTAQDGLPLEPGRYVTLTVSDNGMGIPREFLTKIFDPYFSGKRKGSGLGLTTAFSVVKNHGGHITVQSEVGVGSTFTVFFPAAKEVSPDPAPPPVVEAGGPSRVLIMDDEIDLREAAADLLEFLGYHVELAASGEEAIERCRTAASSGSAFDIAIMDLTIPGGMGGREAILEVRKITPHIRSIVSSGYSNDPIMADCKRYGFDAVLPKPYQVEDLKRVMSSLNV